VCDCTCGYSQVVSPCVLGQRVAASKSEGVLVGPGTRAPALYRSSNTWLGAHHVGTRVIITHNKKKNLVEGGFKNSWVGQPEYPGMNASAGDTAFASEWGDPRDQQVTAAAHKIGQRGSRPPRRPLAAWGRLQTAWCSDSPAIALRSETNTK
jgi:hypothetical protein